jgi:pre-mRNA-splicing factor ATP-dependent RNA helicase DHX15/PRP43
MKDIGILDQEFKHPNPLTGEPYSEEYKKLFKKMIKLAAYNDRDKVINTIKDNQITIISAPTGIGKTVWLPKFALHSLNYEKKIVATNPKRVLTQSNAEFMAKTLDVELGKEVGYKYKGSPEGSSSDDTKLLFATDGYLSSLILGKDPYLSELDAVILDEVHERKIYMDILMYLLKRIMRKRPNFKVILISATLEADIFKKYYPNDKFKISYLDLGVPTTYPIEVNYSDEPVNDYIIAGVDKIANIIETTDIGAILFFVSSVSETRKVCELLDEKIKSNNICIEFYSGMDPKKQELATDPILYKKLPGSPERKIIVATNVVESSLTVDGLIYVVDSGKEFFVHYDPSIRGTIGSKQFTTQAQVKQRRGRVGRIEPGICYHLFTKEEYNEMNNYPEPEIRKSNITIDILRFMKNSNVGEIKKILNKLIDPPDDKKVYFSLRILLQIGAITSLKDDGIITELGNNILSVRTDDIFMAKSLLESYKNDCLEQVAIIIALTELVNYDIDKIFIKSQNEEKKKYISNTGDHITLLKIYNDFHNEKQKLEKDPNMEIKLMRWCDKNFIKYDILKYVKSNAKKYVKYVNKIFGYKKSKEYSQDLSDAILESLYRGLYMNVAKKENSKYKLYFRKTINASINRFSFVNRDYELIMFNQLFVMNNRPEVRMISIIPKHIADKYNLKSQLT